ncbi:polysaccharide biosynthesis protein [Winogradskyella aurantiaca]|uniref:polysaccharide biosynthesis protein n=1 Tax=Winogradskyella aurantiaca TaxID=2219558 RepID=UPI000E1CA3E0|nr:polysaccharide biosynthesis protein [Winogradskyella aurantiaca]
MVQQQLLYINSDLALQSYRFYKNVNTLPFTNTTALLGSNLAHKQLRFKHFDLSDLDSLRIGSSVSRDILVATPISNIVSCLEDLRFLEALGFDMKIITSSEFWNKKSTPELHLKTFNTTEVIKYQPVNKPGNLEFYKDKTILITGAGGSIGNELLDYIKGIKFNKLILLDHSEYAIHHLKLKIRNESDANIEIVIGSIRDKNKLRTIFTKYAINIVFHLAAYKHVGIMEADPYEAFKCNVIGTKNLLDLSDQFEVSQFNFISTDKAVNPLGVMGLTKKLAESYMLNYKSNTKVTVLRFGNVFGSSGSVVENFESAISKNATLRISHKHMKRYFTLPKDIASFIMSSPLYANHKDTMVFNVSEQTSILDLAKVILLLKGYPNNFNYPIEITNSKNQEKLQEELYNPNELVKNTECNQINRIPFTVEDNNIIEQIQSFNTLLNKYPERVSFELLQSLYKKTKIIKA